MREYNSFTLFACKCSSSWIFKRVLNYINACGNTIHLLYLHVYVQVVGYNYVFSCYVNKYDILYNIIPIL